MRDAANGRVPADSCKIHCTNTCTSGTIHTFAAVNSSNETKRRSHRAGLVLNRIADRIDLAIDVMTLGQYGLEQVPSAGAEGCEGIGQTKRRAGWEPRSQPSRHRGACEAPASISWDWPRARRDAASH